MVPQACEPAKNGPPLSSFSDSFRPVDAFTLTKVGSQVHPPGGCEWLAFLGLVSGLSSPGLGSIGVDVGLLLKSYSAPNLVGSGTRIRECRQFKNIGLQASVSVIPAKAGTWNPVAGKYAFAANGLWIPAFAGMTVNMTTLPRKVAPIARLRGSARLGLWSGLWSIPVCPGSAACDGPSAT